MRDINGPRKWLKAAMAVTTLHLIGIIDLSELQLAGMKVSSDWSSGEMVLWILFMWGSLSLFKVLMHIRIGWISGELWSAFRVEEKIKLLGLLSGGKPEIRVKILEKLTSPGVPGSRFRELREEDLSVEDLPMDEMNISWVKNGPTGNYYIKAQFPFEGLTAMALSLPSYFTNRQKFFTRLSATIKGITMNPYNMDNILTTIAGIIIFFIIVPCYISYFYP